MKVNQFNNFCRVFELPSDYPNQFCFNGGHPVAFKMVDWFQPIPDIKTQKPFSFYIPLLKNFLKDKLYIKPNTKYLLLTDFDESFIFTKDQ